VEANEDDSEHTPLGKMNEDDKPSCVISTISKMVLHRMDSLAPV
jgi:hypothetical protein